MWSYNRPCSYELFHHGIKGQRWGVRNGPPYPIGTQARRTLKIQSRAYSNIASMTVGEIKDTYRSNVEKILSSKGSRKKIDISLEKEDEKYKKALLDKERLDKIKYQNDDSDARTKMAKRVAITVGVLAVTSLAAYGMYKHRDKIKNLINTVESKENWFKKQIENGLTRDAKIFENGSAANNYNTKNLFDNNAWKALADSERDAVEKYTTYHYMKMNTALRTGVYDSEKTKSLVDNCTNALEKSILKEDVFVCRGVKTYNLAATLGVDESVLKKPKRIKQLIDRNHTFTEKAFFSSAGHKNDARSGVKFHTFVPKGSKGMYVDPISVNKGEHEFLLQRNTKFRIEDILTDNSGNITDLMISVVEQIINK